MELRFVTTASTKVGPSYVLEFDIALGCGVAHDELVGNKVFYHMLYSSYIFECIKNKITLYR